MITIKYLHILSSNIDFKEGLLKLVELLLKTDYREYLVNVANKKLIFIVKEGEYNL